jgi:hypothetical protein
MGYRSEEDFDVKCSSFIITLPLPLLQRHPPYACIITPLFREAFHYTQLGMVSITRYEGRNEKLPASSRHRTLGALLAISVLRGPNAVGVCQQKLERARALPLN